MDLFRLHTPLAKVLPEPGNESRRPADVEVAVTPNAQPIEVAHRHAADCVVVPSLQVAVRGAAVPDLASRVGKQPQYSMHLGREGIRRAIPRGVQPPDLPGVGTRRQGMKHGQHGCRTNSTADEHDLPLAWLQGEASSRLTDLEDIAFPDCAQVSAASAARLDFDADSIFFVRHRAGKRIAP